MENNVSAFPQNPADYCEHLNLTLVPMPSASKAPKHKRWQEPDRAFSDAEVARVYFEKFPTSNVGLLHSASGTCAIDIDHIENTQIIFEALGIDFDALMQSAPHSRVGLIVAN